MMVRAACWPVLRKVDDMTVKLILSRPNASLLNTLTMENFRFASPAAVDGAGRYLRHS